MNPYRNGYWILRYLLHRETVGAEFYYSPMTRLELICGGLRGKAIQRAAASGVPNRWYARLSEEEIRLQLEPDGYQAVSEADENVKDQFTAAGIVLNEQESDVEVWGCARAMLEAVFLDVQDCVVYASAFVEQADELISTDGYVSSVASGIENPGGAEEGLKERFEAVQKRLSEWYHSSQLWDQDSVRFPKVMKWKNMQSLIEGNVS